jgi:hypothetical protein
VSGRRSGHSAGGVNGGPAVPLVLLALSESSCLLNEPQSVSILRARGSFKSYIYPSLLMAYRTYYICCNIRELESRRNCRLTKSSGLPRHIFSDRSKREQQLDAEADPFRCSLIVLDGSG